MVVVIIYIKAKLKTFKESIITNFYNEKVPKEKEPKEKEQYKC